MTKRISILCKYSRLLYVPDINFPASLPAFWFRLPPPHLDALLTPSVLSSRICAVAAEQNRDDQFRALCRTTAKSKLLSTQIPILVAAVLLFILVPALLTEITLRTLFPGMFPPRDEKN
jgi:hypothetical protein